MRLVVTRGEPRSIRIDPHEVCPVVLDQIDHTLLHNLVRHTFGEREQVLGCVRLFLIEASAFDTNGVDEKSKELERHLYFRFLVNGWTGASGEAPFTR